MPRDCQWTNKAAAVRITATAFRDGRDAELVMITKLSFDGCELSSDATFTVGERLRLYQPGQGFIEAEVQWISGDRAKAMFLALCNV